MVIVVKRRDIGFRDPKKAEDAVNERVSQLEEAVSKNKGEIILLHRNIYGGSTEQGCFGGGISRDLDIYDVGVISGDLLKVDFKEARPRHIYDIPTPDFDVHRPDAYYYDADIFVPVERKFNARRSLHFSVESLKNAQKGDIDFSRFEVIPEVSVSGYTRSPPFLTEFGIFIGDKEIRDFVKTNARGVFGLGLKRGEEETISDFFRLIRDPGEVQKIITEDLFEKRNDLTGRLLGEVASLANIDAQLSRIKPEVMKISFYYERDQDGSRDRYSSKGDLYSRYLGLRREANEEIKTITSYLEKADFLGLSKEDFSVSGETIGFPSKVSSKEYISFVDVLLLPRVSAKIREMDKHLSEAEKKAK